MCFISATKYHRSKPTTTTTTATTTTTTTTTTITTTHPKFFSRDTIKYHHPVYVNRAPPVSSGSSFSASPNPTTWIRQPSSSVTTFGSSEPITWVNTPDTQGSFFTKTSSSTAGSKSPFFPGTSPSTVPLRTFSAGTLASQKPFYTESSSGINASPTASFNQQPAGTLGQTVGQPARILGQSVGRIVNGVKNWQNQLTVGIHCAINGLNC